MSGAWRVAGGERNLNEASIWSRHIQPPGNESNASFRARSPLATRRSPLRRLHGD